MIIRKTAKNILLQCRCGRPECGLSKTPIRIDDVDAAAMWLPVGYINFIKDSDFLGERKGEHHYNSRLEAAEKYIEDMV